KEDNGPSNQDDVDNESNPNDELDNEHNNKLYSKNVSDDNPEDMIDFD
ncbi:10793_t:CDS:1, partial [Gigaspora margarita]